MNEDLPASVREIADVIGRDQTLYLIGNLPTYITGTEGHKGHKKYLYVPRRLPPDHFLVRVLGWVDAYRLSLAFGGCPLTPALCTSVPKRFEVKEILRLTRAGYSPDSITVMLDTSVTYVRAVIKRGW
jgi:hypothetical protein